MEIDLPAKLGRNLRFLGEFLAKTFFSERNLGKRVFSGPSPKESRKISCFFDELRPLYQFLQVEKTEIGRNMKKIGL